MTDLDKMSLLPVRSAATPMCNWSRSRTQMATRYTPWVVRNAGAMAHLTSQQWMTRARPQ